MLKSKQENRGKKESEDTLEVPQSQSTAFPRHERKEREETNEDTTNATYEITDAQTKKNCHGGLALEGSVGKLLVGHKLVLLAQNLALNSNVVTVQFQTWLSSL